jgi:mRNA-degrading endonuclease toxin of MazEF toxin-antitoxin module
MLDKPSTVDCDGLHIVSERLLTQHLGSLDSETRDEICAATPVALGCDRA